MEVLAELAAAVAAHKAGGRAIVGRRDRGIDPANPKSMEGKKIAHLTGTTNEVYLREWFKKRKLDISKSQLVSVPVENMLGGEGRGFVGLMEQLPQEPLVTLQGTPQRDLSSGFRIKPSGLFITIRMTRFFWGIPL